ncbi:MAG: SCP2 sterol-binding domain-containing protein [Pseudomonadota bacterium]
MTPAFICAAVEVALNRTLRLEPEVLEDFARLDGKVLALTVDGLEWDFFIECIPSGVRVLPSFERRADVHLHGGAVGYAQLARQFKSGDTHLPPGVSIDGDAELLHRFTRLLARIGFEPAELIAKFTGDGAAQRLVGGLQSLFGWSSRSAKTMTLNTAEYLREETYDLARKADADEWGASVETLRDDVARLEARLKRLERTA